MQSQILSRYSRDQFWKLGLLKDGVIWLSRQGIKAVTGGIWYFPRMGTWNSDEERITPKKVPTSIVQKVRAAKEPPEWPSITVFILYSVLKSIHWKSSYRTMGWPGPAWTHSELYRGQLRFKSNLVEMNRFYIEPAAHTSILWHVNGDFSSFNLCNKKISCLLQWICLFWMWWRVPILEVELNVQIETKSQCRMTTRRSDLKSNEVS